MLPHAAPPEVVGTACTTTKLPVLQQRSQDPAILPLRTAWKSPLKSRTLPPLTLPLLPFHCPPPYHNTCHTSLHCSLLSPGLAVQMQPTTTTRRRYATSAGMAHKARASAGTPYRPQGKPATDVHTLQVKQLQQRHQLILRRKKTKLHQR